MAQDKEANGLSSVLLYIIMFHNAHLNIPRSLKTKLSVLFFNIIIYTRSTNTIRGKTGSLLLHVLQMIRSGNYL